MAFRRSFIRGKSIAKGHTDLNLLIDGLKQVKESAKSFLKAQQDTIDDLAAWSLGEQDTVMVEAVKHMQDLTAVWVEIQKEFAENMKKVRCQFSLVRSEKYEYDKLKKKLRSLEREESILDKTAIKPDLTINDSKCIQLKLVELKEQQKQVLKELEQKDKQCNRTKKIRVRDGLKQYAESFLHLSTKCNIVFHSFYKAAHLLPDHTTYSNSDQVKHNLELTRVSVIHAKDKIAHYNRLPFPSNDVLNEIGLQNFESPPPYSPSVSYASPNSSFGAHPYDQVAPDNLIRNLNINVAVPPSSGRYQNVSSLDEQGAVGGHF